MFLLLLGCFGSTYPPPDPLPAELPACDADADCVIVQLGCCDHCNGGEAVAVRVDRAAEVEETYSERCGRSTGCTLMACAELEAVCEDGTCTSQQRDTGLAD